VKTKPTAMLATGRKYLVEEYQDELVLCGCVGCIQIGFYEISKL
jgi:hypothetical protein